MAKRGRKPSATNNKIYFSEEQEKAVLDYINTDSAEEKNRIYETKLKNAFTKMIDSIIRRYHYHIPDETHEETYKDVLSHLITKIDKYDKEKKAKAYSYLGTICRNYLIGRLQNIAKITKRNPSYDIAEDTFKNDIRYSVNDNEGQTLAIESIDKLVEKITLMVENPQNYNLKDTEIKTGKALINLFENWDYVLTTDGSNKLNKNAILLYLRDSTGLNTKGVRDNMQKFKKEFFSIKQILMK